MRKNLLEKSYDRIINVGFCLTPYQDLSDMVDPNVMIFGTTKDEKIFSLEELMEFFKSQYKQMEGIKPSLDRKRISTQISEDQSSALIAEEITLNLASEEINNSLYLRTSCVLQYSANRWILTHWHSSTPVETENDHWHMQEWKREKKKLQQLVDLQTADLQGKNRELEIESSIERVRAVAMGMTKPDDMLKVCRVISDQLQQFGVEHIRNVQTVIVNEEKGTYHNYQFFTPYDKESFEITEYHKNPTVQAMIDRMLESPDAFFDTSLTGEELATFRSYRKKENQFPDPLLDDTESLNAYFFSIGPGGLGITLYYPLNEDGLEIFKRFHNVFSLAYRRFRDIEKAEAQAREARIELSLERIRAQVTSMKESSDLLDIVVTMRSEFVNLGHEAHYFWHMRWLPKKYEKAMTSGDGTRIGMVMTLPRHIHGDIEPVAEWEQTEEPIYVLAMGVDAAVDYVDKMISLGDFEQVDPQAPTTDDIRHIGGLTFIMARTTHGEIGFSLPGVVPNPPKDAIDTLVRFAGVFDLAYKRFEDLKAAERQHRESKIELALERVRARSLAMHQSDELADLSLELVKQVQALGIDTWFCAFNIYDDHLEGSIEWGSNGQGTFPQYRTPREGVFLDYYEAGQRGETLLINEIGEDECPAHYDYLCSLSGVGDQLLKMKEDGIPFPTSQIDHVAFFKYGYIIFITFEPVPEAHNIFKRFAKVFQQTYTRFLDLQKAEEQARESEIQLALERVRARTMAMQKSEELADVAFVLFEQLRGLGGNLWGTGFGLCEMDSDKDYFWFANENGVFPPVSIPNTTDPAHKKMYEGWKNKSEFLALEGSGKDLKNHYNYMMTLPEVRPFFQKILDEGLTFPEWQQWNAAYFSHGYLLIITLEPYPDQEILKRFARVFDQTYTRFLDLQKAEAQAREAQVNLAVERVRARALAMFKSEEILEVVYKLKEEIMGLDIPNVTAATIHLKEPDGSYRAWDLTSISEEENDLEISLDIRWNKEDTHPDFFMREVWDRTEDYFVVIQGGDRYKHTVEWLRQNGHSDYGEEFEDFLESSRLEKAYHPTVPLNNGRMSIDLLDPPVPEIESILKKMAGAFDLAYKRFEDLQKAEAQAREAKIEAALEKVRSRTMAMQKGEELQEVAVLLYKELIALGVENFVSCGYVEIDESTQKQYVWITSPGGDTMGLFYLPLTGDTTFDARYAAWKKKQPVFHQSVAGQVRSDHLEYAITTFQSKEAEEMIRSQFPDPTVFYCFNFSHGYLHIVGGSLLKKEEENLLARFTKVFEQTYTRFLDLQKAEEQAREARIEMSLEKIRSRTMGMQSSDELPEVANMLFLEVQELGIPAWSCGYCILTEDRRASTCIMSSEGTVQKPFLLPHLGEPSFEEWDDFVHGDQTFFTQELGGEAIDSHYNFMKSLPQLKPVFQDLVDAGLSLPAYQINHLCKFSHGFLLFITYEEVPGSHDIFKRFTSVFDQTYTRFLDLKKAEAQTREAQIENALEKVRSRSLAMQHPNELVEVAQLLREEMGALGVEELETSSIYIHDESSGLTQCWFTIKDADDPGKSVTDQMTIDLQDTWVGRQMNQFYDSGQDRTSILMKGDHRIEWIRFCEEKSDLFGTSEFYGETIPERTYHLYKFSNGFLGAASPGNISDESWDLMRRATSAFSFAYTRFRDLQKAEESARRARQQASLDRVRADISGMRSADDLNQITPLIWNELNTLGVPFIRCGVFIIQEHDQQVKVYLSKPDGTSLAVMNLPFGSSELVRKTVDAWQQDSVYTQYWTRVEFLEWGRSMIEQGQVSDLESYQGTEEAPESLHLQFLPFNQGMLYVGSINPLDEEEISLSESLAKAFSIAYARYEDFVKLEKAKAGIEEALAELKATQSQLVQQEKLASLGQLTAGIAHEIKNPLNFVNNFSELSVELIEEIRDEVRAYRDTPLRDQGVEEISELLNDIESNLKTIHKHGTRADSIVKSMLEHSRGGSGKMEPTNLNALVKEFVNLTFHGIRASKNPINVDMDLVLDDSIGKVPLVAEDISRVIINLCNNAFDAMREKEIQNLEFKIQNYAPKLTIRTRQHDSSIFIDIEDNGLGIPEDIKDKIMQPFFTTKKGTEGTGLGLSITNDIIKAHGGKLLIDTNSNQGSTFTVVL